MSQKQKPIGICDFCGGSIPQAFWYTTKRKPRRYCCLDCKNTANSRAGSPVRREKALQRVANGTWICPAKVRPLTSAEQSARARKGRLREVAAGTWRNPALSAEAREKLSRPRIHSGVLHSAIEKLDQGLLMTDLTDEEREAYRNYRRELVAKKRK